MSRRVFIGWPEQAIGQLIDLGFDPIQLTRAVDQPGSCRAGDVGDLVEQSPRHAPGLVVPDRALGHADQIGELGLRQPRQFTRPDNARAYLALVSAGHSISVRSLRMILV